MSNKKSIFDSHTFLAIISIIVGFLVGAIFLLIVKINPLVAYNKIITGVFSRPKYIAYAVVYATPLIFTGLAVAFSFRTGVFNIGAEGQFVMGGIVALVLGLKLQLPPFIHALVCIVAAAIAGALWGMIVGYLKVKWGINEVLSMIMFNWIAFYFSNLIVTLPSIKNQAATPASANVLDSARILLPKSIRKATCPAANYGIILALIATVIIYIIIEKTTLGYRLKAVGFNKDAAEFGGIKVSSAIMSAMAISGALAGIGGAVQLLGIGQRISLFSAQEGFGFQGISVALIGGSNPIGVFFSGLFYGALKYGGSKLNVIKAPSEIVDIIMGTVVFFIAISHVFKNIGNLKLKGEKKNG